MFETDKEEGSDFTRKLSRFMVGVFWTPVGQGPKPKKETDYVIATLFKGMNGVRIFDKNFGPADGKPAGIYRV